MLARLLSAASKSSSAVTFWNLNDKLGPVQLDAQLVTLTGELGNLLGLKVGRRMGIGATLLGRLGLVRCKRLVQ